MSDTIEKQGPKQAKRDKYFALLGIGVLTKAQTEKAQELARKIVKADVQQAKDDAKQEGKDEKVRILYLARRDKCALSLAALEDRLPVTAKLVAEFKAAMDAADLLVTGDDYAGAAAKLEKISATHAPETADKLWRDAAQAAAKRAPAAFQTLAKIDQLLADPKAYLTREAIADARRSKIDLGRALLEPGATQPKIDAAAQTLADLHTRLRTDIETAKTLWDRTEHLRADTSRRLNMIAPLSGDGLALLTDRESAPMRLQLASANTSMNVCEFAAARAVLEPLRDEILAIDARIGPLRDQWLQRQPQLAELLAEARKRVDTAAAPQFKKEALELAGTLGELRTHGPGKGLNLSDAIAFVDGAQGRLDTLRGQESDWLLFQGKASGPVAPDANGNAATTLDAAKTSIETLFTAVDSALEKLHAAVGRATQGKHRHVADALWALRRDEARSEWDARVDLARDAATLDEAGMRAKLRALRQDIDTARRDPALLQAAIDAGRLGRVQDAFTLARQAAQAACDDLIAVDALAGGQEQIAIDAICAPLTQLGRVATPATLIAAHSTATESLQAYATRVAKRTQRRQADIATTQQALKDKLDALVPELLKIKALADAAKTAAKQAPLVALLDTLQASLDGLRAMSGLTQRTLLQDTLAEAETFAQTVAQSINAARGESGDDAMSFDKARKTIANLHDGLGDSKSREYMVETHDKLTEAVKKLEKGLGTMTMTEMTAALGRLTADLKTMKAQAREAKAETEKFEKDTVEPLLKKLEGKAYDDAPGYRKAMKAQIKALVTAHGFEGGQAGAIAKAQTLGQQLDAVLQGDKDARGVPQLLADEQAAVLKRDNEKIVEQGRWEGEAKVVDKQLAALKAVNPREIQPLLDLLESARTSVEKSGDHAGGRQQLMAIRKRLSLIAANPQGLAITARNKLPQVGARVKRSIAAYMAALTAVGQAVQGLPDTDVDAAGKQAVIDQLDSLRGLFNPTSFDEVVVAMSAKADSREQRSGAREMGLREVRRMQAYLDNDSRLRTLADTPFHKAMPSVLSELTLSLLDIENNMLVSI